MSDLSELMRERARAYICGYLGHSLGFKLPVEKRDETREVHAKCRTCGEDVWLQLPEDGWERFLTDLADGKIV